jgi:hypothetical protein
MRKKKVAVEVSGYMRTFFNCVSSWDNLILPNSKEYSFDFFVHTYEYHGYSAGFTQQEIYQDEIVDIEKVSKLINPKSFILEPNLNDVNRKNRIKFMYRKMFLCHESVIEYEKKNNIKYDLYIKIRPDILIKKDLILSIIDKNTGVFNTFTWSYQIVDGMLCDQIFICGKEAMEGCTNLFLDWEKYEDKTPELLVYPELLLYNQVTSKNTKIIYQDFNIEILR